MLSLCVYISIILKKLLFFKRAASLKTNRDRAVFWIATKFPKYAP